jgi:TolB-like protein/tetratricopeptide (TPR) repeat protein
MRHVLARLKRRAFSAAVLCGLAALLAAGPQAKAAEASNTIALAVLPFTNASGNAGEDASTDGVSAEISAALARVPELHVRARASAFKFKDQPRDLPMIGRVLGISHVVEGSFQKTGDHIRITARLVRAGDGMELWSENYDGAFADIFAMQETIAKTVAEALGVQVPEHLVPDTTKNMDAYEKYLRALPLIRARDQKSLAAAAVLLEQAVAEDPDFVPAVALLAFDDDLAPLYQDAFRSGKSEEAHRFVASVIPKAEALARHAIALDPMRADAVVALAYAEMVQRKLLRADELFRQALALDAHNTDALHGYSQLLAASGRIKDALAMRDVLQALEPFIVSYVADTGEIFWLDGQNDKAVAMLDTFRPGRTSELAQVLASLGRYREAALVLREMNAASYAPGMLEAAAHLLESAPHAAANPGDLPRLGNLGFVYLYVGAQMRVLDYYESNLEAGYFQPISTTWFWHPSYAPVRRTERFKAYARAIGLVEMWRARGWPDLCRPSGADDFTCD